MGLDRKHDVRKGGFSIRERTKEMRKMSKMIKAVIAAALIATLLCGSALAASYGAKVLVSSMTVYGKSGSQVVALGSLSQGTSFSVTAVSGDWARISYKGHTGYAKLDDIVFNKHVKGVTTRDTEIRFVTRASYKEGVYYRATLAAGTTVYVAGKNGDDYLVYNASGSALGYVSASAVVKN